MRWRSSREKAATMNEGPRAWSAPQTAPKAKSAAGRYWPLGLTVFVLGSKTSAPAQFQHDPMENEEISFGPFRLDLRRPELRRDGQPVRIHRRALGILCALAD